MLQSIRLSTLQAGLVLFWAAWLTVVTLTNITDALRQLGALPSGFGWASYNFDLVRETVGAHGVPVAVAALLFAGVIAWEILASALLWQAWNVMRKDSTGAAGSSAEVTRAFAVSIALWCAFLMATEVFINYATAGTHKATLIAQIATLLLIRMRTERGQERAKANDER